MRDVEENCENKMALQNPGVRDMRVLLAPRISGGHLFLEAFFASRTTDQAKEGQFIMQPYFYQREVREFWKVMSVSTMFHYITVFFFIWIVISQTWRLREVGNPVISLGFAPRINPSDFCGFFITGTAWGQFKQKGDAELRNGTAEVSLWSILIGHC